jgi:hypothetical protein
MYPVTEALTSITAVALKITVAQLTRKVCAINIM